MTYVTFDSGKQVGKGNRMQRCRLSAKIFRMDSIMLENNNEKNYLRASDFVVDINAVSKHSVSRNSTGTGAFKYLATLFIVVLDAAMCPILAELLYNFL